MAKLSPIEIAQFWSRVDAGPAFQCWEWKGAKNATGYGRCHGTGAHRVAYELANGEIPDGMLIRHKCDNPMCCNPKHLVPGTHRQNSGDMVARGRHLRGERNPRSKLSEDDAREILRNPERMGVRALAKRFGVSPATVSLIRSGDRWSHLAK